MSFTIEVKRKGLFKNKITVPDLLTEELGYGIQDDDYRLDAGEIAPEGESTLIYSTKEIGRGFFLTINDKEVVFDVQEPSTAQDIKVLIEVLAKVLKLAKNDAFTLTIDDDETMVIKADNLDNFAEALITNQEEVLKNIIANPDYVTIKVFAVHHPLAIKKEAFQDLDSFAKLLHKLQDQDVYYAAPTLFGNKEEKFGCFTLTTNTNSLLPLNPKSTIWLTDIEINEWYLNFFDYEKEEVLGSIRYQDFLDHADTNKKFDEERFYIQLNKEEMQQLLEQFKVDLF